MDENPNNKRLYSFLLIFYLAAVGYVLITSSVQKYFDLGFTTYTWSTMLLLVLLNYMIKGFFLAGAIIL
ncbi:MAG: hypothetical protein AAF039_17490, partial [Bacteroidota bacterium]